MRITEAATIGKYGDPDRNEDVLLLGPNFVAVFDGATDLDADLVAGRTAGRFAADIAKKTLSALPPDTGAYSAVSHITEALNAARAVYDVPHHRVPCCVFAVYSRARREVWRLGDPHVMVDAEMIDPLPIPSIDALCSFRAAVVGSYIAGGATLDELRRNDPSMEAYRLLSRHNFDLMNNHTSPFGYGVINGSPVPEKFVQVIPAHEAQTITLASDGYPRVYTTLAETDLMLTDRLARDPLMTEDPPQPRGIVPKGLSFDDRTYVKIDLA